MSTACAGMPIEVRLERAQMEVMDIKRRYFVLRAFLMELDEVTRGKTFRIHNDAVWMMLIDSRDMLVVHLASWCKAAYRPGGLFGQLQALHIKDLRQRSMHSSGDSYLDRRTHEGFSAAYGRLFPGADPAKIQPKDVAALKDAFQKKVADVVGDRDTHRAHAWEKQGQGSAKMLGLDEIGATFEAIESLLNDLRLVATGATLHSSALLNVSPKVTAQDIVDLLLVGSHYEVRRARGERRRDEYYAELHRLHDTKQTTELFNKEVALPDPAPTPDESNP